MENKTNQTRLSIDIDDNTIAYIDEILTNYIKYVDNAQLYNFHHETLTCKFIQAADLMSYQSRFKKIKIDLKTLMDELDRYYDLYLSYMKQK